MGMTWILLTRPRGYLLYDGVLTNDSSIVDGRALRPTEYALPLKCVPQYTGTSGKPF